MYLIFKLADDQFADLILLTRDNEVNADQINIIIHWHLSNYFETIIVILLLNFLQVCDFLLSSLTLIKKY